MTEEIAQQLSLSTNDLQTPIQCVSVLARVRPFLAKEKQPEQNEEILRTENNKIILIDPQHRDLQNEYDFDHVYDESSTTEQIFQDSIVPNLQNVLRGLPYLQINYGVSGTGKTFTSFGNEKLGQKGLIHYIYNYISQQLPDAQIYFSCVQIYMNTITDLLDSNKQLRLYIEKDDYLPNRLYAQVANEKQLQHALQMALRNRETSATSNNSASSRSHCIAYLIIQQNGYQNQVVLLDLAGSEKFYTSMNKQTIQEGSFIRTSLLALDRCIRELKQVNELYQRQANNIRQVVNQMVTFRSSLLTMVIKQLITPKIDKENHLQLPSSIKLILNLHKKPEQFTSLKESLNIGLLTKSMKNYALTPSRLGKLNQSVSQLGSVISASQLGKSSRYSTQSRVQSSGASNRQTTRSQTQQQQQMNESVAVDECYQYLEEQLIQLQAQIGEITAEVENDIIKARFDAVNEAQQLFECWLEQKTVEYEKQLEEKDKIIEQLKQLAKQQ